MEASASGMICAKCGTPNAAGDAFCGNCGAFLEFAAEEAGAPGVASAAVGPEGVAGAPGVASAAGAAEVTAAHPTPAAAAPAPTTPPAAAAPPSVATTGPSCPACGRANPAGRTFCISCGERLPAAGRLVATPPPLPARAVAPPAATPPAVPVAPAAPVAAAPPVAPAVPPAAAPPAAAPPSPAGSAWEFPTAPVRPVAAQAAKPGPTPGVPAPATRRGGSPLPLIVGVGILFLVLAGGGAAVLLGGSANQASPAPATPGTSAAASGALPSASTAASSAGAASSQPSAAPATLPPGPAIGLTLTGATASSSLAKRPASAAIDGDPTTTWKTGTPSPADQWLQVTFAPAAVTRIQVWNGWQRTRDFYAGNHRPHNVTIRFDTGTPIPLELKDVYGSQRVDIPPELGIVGVTTLRITILDWYPAKKTPAAGSPTTQAAISEIRLYGIPVTP